MHHILEDAANHVLEQVTYLLLGQERSLAVDLGKFGLAVSAQVFITKTLGYLIITIKTRHHEHLLEQLWRLRQGKELPRIDARWHQIVTCALGRTFGQHRRFNVDKTLGIKIFSYLHGNAITQAQIVLHIGATQVEYTVRQACGFAQVVIIELKRRCHAGIEHFQLMTQDFNFTRTDIRVYRTVRTTPHQPRDLDTKFITHTFCDFEHLGAIRVADDLCDTFTVAQINKNDTAMITPTLYPATQGHVLA